MIPSKKWIKAVDRNNNEIQANIIDKIVVAEEGIPVTAYLCTEHTPGNPNGSGKVLIIFPEQIKNI